MTHRFYKEVREKGRNMQGNWMDKGDGYTVPYVERDSVRGICIKYVHIQGMQRSHKRNHNFCSRNWRKIQRVISTFLSSVLAFKLFSENLYWFGLMIVSRILIRNVYPADGPLVVSTIITTKQNYVYYGKLKELGGFISLMSFYPQQN